MQDIARLKHRMPHPRNELRCTLFQKAAKYHGVSVGGSHHSAWIHPDAHRSRRFQRSRISRAGNRRGQATPYSCRRRSRLCRGFLPQASSAHPESPPGLRPRHRCELVSHFSCPSFGTRFTMSSGTPGQSDHVVGPFERVTSITVPFSELVSTSTVPP